MTWIFREGRLQSTDNGHVLTIRKSHDSSFQVAYSSNSNFHVALATLDEEDSLQQWSVDEGGRILPSTNRDLALASVGKMSKAARRHGIGIRSSAFAVDAKNKQDQTFTLRVVLSSDEVK